MEGISSKSLSLAGTLGLSKLIILYDSNRITIEGSTDIAFTENVLKRVAAFGFQTLKVEDGNDLESLGEENIIALKKISVGTNLKKLFTFPTIKKLERVGKL